MYCSTVKECFLFRRYHYGIFLFFWGRKWFLEKTRTGKKRWKRKRREYIYTERSKWRIGMKGKNLCPVLLSIAIIKELFLLGYFAYIKLWRRFFYVYKKGNEETTERDEKHYVKRQRERMMNISDHGRHYDMLHCIPPPAPHLLLQRGRILWRNITDGWILWLQGVCVCARAR